jgi:Ca-activated chloride channel family protein
MSLDFIWPACLWGFALVPGVAAAYVWAIRRSVRRVVAYPDVATLAAALGAGGRIRRHVPAAAFLLGVTAVIMALARPVFPIPVPADRSAIVLAIDISGSMRSTDIAPTRIDAAKRAARTFVETLPAGVRVGLVTFGGYATLVVPPGTDHARVVQALDGLRLIRRTAIGEGLLEAVAALPGRVRPLPDGTLPPIPPGRKSPGIVILLSDGRSNTGIDSVRAAEIARQQEVSIFTVGVGSKEYRPGAWMIGGPLDDVELQAIARAGGGTYYHASSADALRNVYRRLARMVGWERRPDEVSGMFAFVGAVALIASLAAARLVTYPLGF